MRLARPEGFADLGDLLLQVERGNYPQTFLRMRRSQGVAGAAEHAGETMTWEQVAAASGTRAIFELAVKSRRRATWQGLVQWEGEPACVPFFASPERGGGFPPGGQSVCLEGETPQSGLRPATLGPEERASADPAGKCRASSPLRGARTKDGGRHSFRRLRAAPPSTEGGKDGDAAALSP